MVREEVDAPDGDISYERLNVSILYNCIVFRCIVLYCRGCGRVWYSQLLLTSGVSQRHFANC